MIVNSSVVNAAARTPRPESYSAPLLMIDPDFKQIVVDEDPIRYGAYEFELTDPEFLAEPVTGGIEWAYRPDLEFTRDPCELDNARQFTNE